MYGVTITELINKMGLKNLTQELDTDKIVVAHPEVNRPALQLTGFYSHFDNERVQMLGNVEIAYLQSLPIERRKAMYDKLISSKIPCILFCRNLMPEEWVTELCNHYGVACLVSEKTTSDVMAEVIRWMKVKLAPCISIHGVLVDVFGEGVLITGESGIGKSEAALELIKRGHRLVSDDVVEIRKVSDETLKNTQSIDMVIQLEEWDKDREYDRLGMEDQYTEYLGNRVVCHKIPIRPGRNLAIIVESAAVNYRQKKMGYNAAKELYNRVQANMAKRD